MVVCDSSGMRLLVTNDRKRPMRVVVEPWGDFVEVPAGGSARVICSDTVVGYVNIVTSETHTTLWAEGDQHLELRIDREGGSTSP